MFHFPRDNVGVATTYNSEWRHTRHHLLTMLIASLQVGSLLGCLVAHGALTLQQVHRTSLAAAAASGKATQGKPCGVEIRRRLMQSAVDALAKGTCHTEAQQQLTSAGLEGHFVPAKVCTV